MTLANKLTLARLVLAVFTFACLWAQRPAWYAVGLALYVTATLTDWIDGYVARSTGQTSPFGALADPIADKVLVLGALIAFLRVPELEIPSWAVFLIVLRELVIGGLRALAGVSGQVLSANRGGKWTMGVQSASIISILALLVWRHHASWPIPGWALGAAGPLIALCAAVSVASGVHYIYGARGLIQHSWNAPKRRNRE